MTAEDPTLYDRLRTLLHSSGFNVTAAVSPMEFILAMIAATTWPRLNMLRHPGYRLRLLPSTQRRLAFAKRIVHLLSREDHPLAEALYVGWVYYISPVIASTGPLTLTYEWLPSKTCPIRSLFPSGTGYYRHDDSLIRLWQRLADALAELPAETWWGIMCGPEDGQEGDR